MLRKFAFRVGATATGAFLGCAVLFLLVQLPITSASPAVASQNGDINGDQSIDIGDAVALLNFLFNNGAAPVACAQTTSCPACNLSDVEVDKLTSFLSIVSVAGNDVSISSNGTLELNAGGSVNLSSADNIVITAGATLDANGSIITLN